MPSERGAGGQAESYGAKPKKSGAEQAGYVASAEYGEKPVWRAAGTVGEILGRTAKRGSAGAKWVCTGYAP